MTTKSKKTRKQNKTIEDKYIAKKEETCNGCKNLNFKLKQCFSGKGIVDLNTFTDANGFVTIFKPCCCSGYVKGK